MFDFFNLYFLFFLFFKWFHLWPVDIPSSQLLSLFKRPVVSISFLAFWHHTMFQAYLVQFLHQTWNLQLLPGGSGNSIQRPQSERQGYQLLLRLFLSLFKVQSQKIHFIVFGFFVFKRKVYHEQVSSFQNTGFNLTSPILYRYLFYPENPGS